MPPHPEPGWHIYKEQMAFWCHGDALWQPAPTHNYQRISIGDVGFIRCGQFHFLFSAGRPLGERRLGIDVPLTFVELPPDAITTFSQPRSPGCLHTDTVVEIGAGIGVSAAAISPLEPGADFSYELTGKRGAALVTRHQTYKQDALRRDAFEEYTKKHYDSWVAFSRDNQYGSDAKPVLVSGVDMTKDFAMAAYSHEGTSLAAERTISIPTIGSAPASLWGTWRTRGPTHTNHGPQQCVPPSSAQVTQTSSEPTSAGSVSDDYNQCVFVRYYTMRERMGFYSRMPRAAAGSHDPGPGSNRDDTFPESTSVNEGWGSAAVDTGSDQDIVVYNTPQDEEYDEFDIIADYVFQNSNATSVLAHHRDLAEIRATGGLGDISFLLAKTKPRILVEGGGVGRISYRGDRPSEKPTTTPLHISTSALQQKKDDKGFTDVRDADQALSSLSSPSPFMHDLLPHKDESPQERARREKEEARAKAVSNAIDEQIKQDKVAFIRYQKATKILLLGQSESGKSTTIKNFQLKYAYKAWVQERSSWKAVIHLNLIRSVTRILEILNRVMREHDDRLQRQQRSLSPSQLYRGGNPLPISGDHEFSDDDMRDLNFSFSDKHKLLQLKLQPLVYAQRDLEKYLGSAALELDQVATTNNVVFPSPSAEPSTSSRRQTEFSVSANSSWKFRLPEKRDSKRPAEKKFFQELHDTAEIVYRCGPDIKRLWADEVVQQVLKGTKAQLEQSSGFFMDDIDRVVARDYEPSDQDVVRARLRTVGVQEYHFSTSGGTGHDDWILYDLGGSRTSRNAWASHFDNINAIIFLAPLNCFDQRLVEDTSVNRLEDSLHIWKSVCNSKLLANTQLILFFNKIDLLMEKLASGVRFNKYVVQYGRNPNDVPSVISFLKQEFRAILRSSGSQRVFYCYPTSATDTKAMARTLVTVYDGIIRNALGRAQFL